MPIADPSTAQGIPAVESDLPIILVHGIHDDSRKLRGLDRALTRSGLTTHNLSLAPSDGSIPLDVLAHQLQKKIDALLPPDTRYSLIGFSMGGLITRYYLQRLADPQRINTFITIASPHGGTLIARFFRKPGIVQMRARSAFLRDLDTDARTFSHIRWVTIRTPLDLMIVPSRSSHLTWAENHCLPVLAHALLVWDTRVVQKILEALRPTPTTPQ